VQVSLFSVSSEGHFTFEAERASGPYLRSHCNGVTKIYYIAVCAHALQAVLVRLKSVSNEGHFTLEVERVFITYLP
jgi:hypothetical protein